MDLYNLVSLSGLFVLVGVAWLLSADRRRVNGRCLAAGIGLQLALAAVVFWFPGSGKAFYWVNKVVVRVLDAAFYGVEFVFGPLAAAPGQTDFAGQASVGRILAFQVFPIIIFFAALMGLLYYWGIMQRIIRGFAWLFTGLMRVSGAESLCAASNIFVGIESATTVRPYLARMTRSELCTVLTAGMATVASSVMAAYVTMLQATFPGIAGHLISASLLSAPAAIVMSKLILPEDGQPVTLGRTVAFHYERESSAVESIINGAMAGVRLVVGIVALLIAFLGLLSLVNLGLGELTTALGAESPWSLSMLLGYVFRPLAHVIGVPAEDAGFASRLLGERLIMTEIPAYQHLAEALAEQRFAHPRSPVVIAYALCGFAHVASLAIFVGGVAALVPDRRKELASVGPRALLAATLACLMTGAVAGTFFHAGGPTVLQTTG